ncbi:MAG: methionine adenosyltransferase [Sphingobacteriales bacterium]|nr:MAG: methionine adenosyltransferase [Sphingobacteriales bacterium]
MSAKNFSFTSESVSEGHPDKICDQISDAILDAYLAKDPNAKVACECLITTGQLVIAGEITSTAQLEQSLIEIAKEVLKNIGYDDEGKGFDYKTASYTNLLHQQSPEINQSVADGGAGDQGLMFGYACRETPELMPLPIILSHQILLRLAEARKKGTIAWLLPDAKSQVTVRYENDQPVSVEKVVLSTQHLNGVSQEEIRQSLIEKIIDPAIAQYLPSTGVEYLINPSGSFTIGGPHGDTGLTGRKIIVDTYGGSCPHGGGAFSGKDPSKVDRSAAYAARYLAKHVVAAELAERCTVQVSYAIGKAEPTSIFLDFHGTGKQTEQDIIDEIEHLFDLTPKGISNELRLKTPIYLTTAAYGHFGKDGLPWEILDKSKVEALKQLHASLEKRSSRFDFKDKAIDELVVLLNQQVGNPGWGTARSEYLYALRKAFLQSGYDCSSIMTETSLSLSQKVKIEGNKIVPYE